MVQGIAAESRAKLARLKEAWKEKAVVDKAVERGDVSKIKKKKVLPATPRIVPWHVHTMRAHIWVGRAVQVHDITPGSNN